MRLVFGVRDVGLPSFLLTTNCLFFSTLLLQCIAEFKPRLERILREVIILSEVSELAMEAEILEASANASTSTSTRGRPASERGTIPSTRNNSRSAGSIMSSTAVHWSPALHTSSRKLGDAHNRKVDDDDSDGGDGNASDEDDDDDASIGANKFTSSRSGNHELIHLLEHWDEPKNVMDKVSIVLLLLRKWWVESDCCSTGEASNAPAVHSLTFAPSFFLFYIGFQYLD
jgi:hypothetical protein